MRVIYLRSCLPHAGSNAMYSVNVDVECLIFLGSITPIGINDNQLFLFWVNSVIGSHIVYLPPRLLLLLLCFLICYILFPSVYLLYVNCSLFLII